MRPVVAEGASSDELHTLWSGLLTGAPVGYVHRRMLTLYATPLSANGRKVLAVCRHLGIDVDVHVVDVYRGEGRDPAYRSIHPLGKVPALVDGDFTLWESNAILQYLAESHGNFALWSRDPKRRADIARWMYWEASQWQPVCVAALAGFVGRLVVPQLAATPPVEVDWRDARFRSQVELLDAQLGGREFLAGDALSLADFSVAAMMMYARPAGFPFETYAGIAAWYRRIERLDAWKATAAGPWAY